jgi:hypothetical protein
MRVEHGLRGTVANTYRALAAALQFARAATHEEQYVADEYDTTGHYQARYVHDGVSGDWTKQKERYFSLLVPKSASPGAFAQVAPQIRRSQATIHLTADGRPEAVRSYDEVDIKGAQQAVHAETSMSLTAEGVGPLDFPVADAQAAFAAMDRVDAADPYGPQAPTEAFDTARIGGYTFATVVTRLEATLRDEAGGDAKDSERQTLFAALAAILREQEASVRAAEQAIRAKSPVSELLIDALGSASTPASERALVALMGDKTLNASQRARASSSLVRTPRPDPAAIDALKNALEKEPFNPKALYGLGTYARRLRDSGKRDEARDLGEFLIRRLASAGGPSATATALRAIANSGYAPALPVVTPYLDDARDGVRVAAVRALQSMQDAKVDQLIAHSLGSDPSNDVQISAIDAARVREPSDQLAQALASSATGASDPHVRYGAVELMTQWLPLRPDFRATLERVARNDEEERIRERAKAAL